MGLTYIVHRLSPEALERVRAEHREHPDLDWAGARRLFAELGRHQPPCATASSWDEYEFLFEFEGWSLVALLAASGVLGDGAAQSMMPLATHQVCTSKAMRSVLTIGSAATAVLASSGEPTPSTSRPR